jgi:hypothetical protein
LDRASPGSAGDGDIEPTERTGDDVGVGIEVDRLLVHAGGLAEPTADVHLDDVVARRAGTLDCLDRGRQGALEAAQPVGKPA